MPQGHVKNTISIQKILQFVAYGKQNLKSFFVLCSYLTEEKRPSPVSKNPYPTRLVCPMIEFSLKNLNVGSCTSCFAHRRIKWKAADQLGVVSSLLLPGIDLGSEEFLNFSQTNTLSHFGCRIQSRKTQRRRLWRIKRMIAWLPGFHRSLTLYLKTSVMVIFLSAVEANMLG